MTLTYRTEFPPWRYRAFYTLIGIGLGLVVAIVYWSCN